MTDHWESLLVTLRERFSADADPDEIADFLAAEGFDRRQIGEIVARFRRELARGASSGPRRRSRRSAVTPAASAASLAQPLPPIRVLGPHELGRFTAEAWGRLLALYSGGVLTVVELEQVVERAMMQIDGRVGSAELRAILEGFGLEDNSGGGDPMTIH